MYKKIFVYDTLRELLLFLLIINLDEEIIWVFIEDEEIFKKLNGKKIKIKDIIYKGENKLLYKICLFYFGLKNRIYLLSQLKTLNFKKFQIFGYNHTLYDYIFLSEKKYIIEDGLKDYIPEVYKKNLK